MNKLIQLHQNQWILQFTLSTDDWCEFALIGEKQTYRLGAERLCYVAERLFHVLCEDDEQVNSDNQSYSWVLSLAEIHSSLYVVQKGDSKCLLWQDENAKDLAEICLSSVDCLTWCNQLKQIISSASG
jgi:hypothetical protein